MLAVHPKPYKEGRHTNTTPQTAQTNMLIRAINEIIPMADSGIFLMAGIRPWIRSARRTNLLLNHNDTRMPRFGASLAWLVPPSTSLYWHVEPAIFRSSQLQYGRSKVSYNYPSIKIKHISSFPSSMVNGVCERAGIAKNPGLVGTVKSINWPLSGDKSHAKEIPNTKDAWQNSEKNHCDYRLAPNRRESKPRNDREITVPRKPQPSAIGQLQVRYYRLRYDRETRSYSSINDVAYIRVFCINPNPSQYIYMHIFFFTKSNNHLLNQLLLLSFKTGFGKILDVSICQRCLCMETQPPDNHDDQRWGDGYGPVQPHLFGDLQSIFAEAEERCAEEGL